MTDQAEIVYCNLHLIKDSKPFILRNVVYKNIDGYYSSKKLHPTPMKVTKVDVIKSLGFGIKE